MKKPFLLLCALTSLRASDFPAIVNTQANDRFPMTAPEAAATMKLPPGFQVSVFAAEPDVMNPVAMSWDTHGRLWIAENYTYEGNRYTDKMRDRILVFDGADGGKKFQSRKVFTDELEHVTGVTVGYGGVWVTAPPQLLFIPDRNEDGVPDGPAEVVLDGFAFDGPAHTIENGLKFGPDGWLYGRCGHSNPSDIGPPGTPKNERVALRGTLWRYHPLRKTTEVLSAGTVNPWGHDWDKFGELFFVNTVIGHLWYEIPGAHFKRSSVEPNPKAYEQIDMIADHWHFETSVGWMNSKDTPGADALGGGHADVGMMIYQGDNWPAEYRDGLYTLNLFGHRTNHEILERSGSGYVGHHGADLFNMTDPWFRGIDLDYGPDGGVFILDWSDTGDYHNRRGVNRTSGRIYKITYGDAQPSTVGELRSLTVEQLVALNNHANEWFPRRARLELMARSLDGRGVGNARQLLRAQFDAQTDVPLKLRSLWTLYDLGGADEAFLRTLLKSPDEHLRVWAIRLLTDFWPIDTVMSQRPAASVAGPEAKPSPSLIAELDRMAAEDSSSLVRLVLASTLQRLPFNQRPGLAAGLVAHKADAQDKNLPLMVWYGLIPLAHSDPAALASLAAKSELPAMRKYATRRLAEDFQKNPGPVNALVAAAAKQSDAFLADVVAGLANGLKGMKNLTKPAAWDACAQRIATSSDPALHESGHGLAVMFGDPAALEDMRKIALDPKADPAARREALQSLLDGRAAGLRETVAQLLTVKSVNAVAATALATFDDPAIGPALVNAYPAFEPADRPRLIAALTARPGSAGQLLDAITAGKIKRTDLSAIDARQIRNLNVPALTQRLAGVWGEIRETPAAKQQLAANYKAQLTPDVLAAANRADGRTVFTNTCAPCHTLYGQGGKIGPDLTGGERRHNLDSLLAKITDPSSELPTDSRYTILKLKDGRTLAGMVANRTDTMLTLKSITETSTVALNEIQSTEVLPISLMPEGLFENLNPTQRRDLVGYLMSDRLGRGPGRGP